MHQWSDICHWFLFQRELILNYHSKAAPGHVSHPWKAKKCTKQHLSMSKWCLFFFPREEKKNIIIFTEMKWDVVKQIFDLLVSPRFFFKSSCFYSHLLLADYSSNCSPHNAFQLKSTTMCLILLGVISFLSLSLSVSVSLTSSGRT